MKNAEGKEIKPAEQRRYRSYPLAYRCFSTQCGIHPVNTDITEWVPYSDFSHLMQQYMKVFIIYRKLKHNEDIPNKDIPAITREPKFQVYFRDDITLINQHKTWTAFTEYMKLHNRYTRLYDKTLKLAQKQLQTLEEKTT